MTSKAVVLAGGGLFGIGWETGIVYGMETSGLNLDDANLIIGTSAGSVVASILRQDGTMEHGYRRFSTRDENSSEIIVPFDSTKYQEAMQALQAKSKSRRQFLQEVGKFALAARTPSEEVRLHIIAKRLSSNVWPQKLLAVTCVDSITGELEVITSGSKIPLVKAVSASCAVPGVWPATTIEDRKYFDGGIRSITNADLAAGFERVLVILPSTSDLVVESTNTEIKELESLGCDVMLVVPNRVSLETVGKNPLDPACLQPAAHAGFKQGANMSDMVSSFWNDI